MRSSHLLCLLLAGLGCQSERTSTSRGDERGCAVSDSPAAGAVAIPWLPAEVARHAGLFHTARQAHGVDAELVAIVTLVESGGFTRARSPSGARGLMQLMPRTARWLTDELGLSDHDSDRLDDPAYNVDLGSHYLARQLADFDGDVALAAAAYNGGPGALRRHLEEDGPMSAQTDRYRGWVSGMWNERRAAGSETFSSWVAAGGDRLLGMARDEMRPD